MATIPVIKVKSSDPKSQGPYVVINEADFDPKVHKKYEDKGEDPHAVAAEPAPPPPPPSPAPTPAEDAAAQKTAKPKFGAKH